MLSLAFLVSFLLTSKTNIFPIKHKAISSCTKLGCNLISPYKTKNSNFLACALSGIKEEEEVLEKPRLAGVLKQT